MVIWFQKSCSDLNWFQKDPFDKDFSKMILKRFKAPYSLKSLENNPGDGCRHH